MKGARKVERVNKKVGDYAKIATPIIGPELAMASGALGAGLHAADYISRHGAKDAKSVGKAVKKVGRAGAKQINKIAPGVGKSAAAKNRGAGRMKLGEEHSLQQAALTGGNDVGESIVGNRQASGYDGGGISRVGRLAAQSMGKSMNSEHPRKAERASARVGGGMTTAERYRAAKAKQQ